MKLKSWAVYQCSDNARVSSLARRFPAGCAIDSPDFDLPSVNQRYRPNTGRYRLQAVSEPLITPFTLGGMGGVNPIKKPQLDFEDFRNLQFGMHETHGFETRIQTRSCLDMITIEDENILFHGWAIEVDEKKPVTQFMLIRHNTQTSIVVHSTDRLDVNKEFNIDDNVKLGFVIAVKKEEFFQGVILNEILNGIFFERREISCMVRLFGSASDGGMFLIEPPQ